MIEVGLEILLIINFKKFKRKTYIYQAPLAWVSMRKKYSKVNCCESAKYVFSPKRSISTGSESLPRPKGDEIQSVVTGTSGNLKPTTL